VFMCVCVCVSMNVHTDMEQLTMGRIKFNTYDLGGHETGS
jgi:hypothetical protein